MAMTPRANAFVIEYLFAVSPLRFLAEIGAARAPLEVTTLATHMLFHASLLHLGLNCVWLLAFGAPVARRLGQGGEGAFLALFILSGMAGALLYILMNAKSPLLLIGASGGVSGLLGAMVRFMFARGGAAPLFDRQVLIWSASVIVLNLMFGLFGGAIFGLGDSNIAWQAHVGGYVFGLLTAPLFLRMAWR
jgi:membrane associated rhomboid family serine protease